MQENLFGGRGCPAGGDYSAPQTPSWWGGAGCTYPQNSHLLSALRASGFGPSGLA